MSILIDKNTRLVVQGITGRDGAFHTQQMMRVRHARWWRGVTPGKGGEKVHGVPVFDSVAEARGGDPRQRVASSTCPRRSRPTRSSRPPTRGSR